MHRPTCNTCPYWGRLGEYDSVLHGRCQIRAPAIIQPDYVDVWNDTKDSFVAAIISTRFPVTAEHDGCGEHPDFRLWIASITS